MKRVEFFYDVVSPYSYLSWGRLSGICEERGAELVLRPMLLRAVHKAAGITSPVEIATKSKYQIQDIHRWAHYYGLPLDFPEPFPFRSLKTMRAAIFCEGLRKLEDFTREAFGLYWEEGGAPKSLQESDEDGPISRVAERIGADPEEVLEGAATPDAKEGLKVATTSALERGVFGAPSFFVDGEMFWGNDRLHFVDTALASV